MKNLKYVDFDMFVDCNLEEIIVEPENEYFKK